jgi:hypothetical protein
MNKTENIVPPMGMCCADHGTKITSGLHLDKEIREAMNTIIVPERIKGKDLVYPMGICCTDINGASNPDMKSPVIKIGNTVDGKKIGGNLDA